MAQKAELQELREDLVKSFDSGITLSYEYRMGQLKKCAAMIKAMEQVNYLIDLGSFLSEVRLCYFI